MSPYERVMCEIRITKHRTLLSLKEFQQSLTRTARGVLRGKTQVLGSMPARSGDAHFLLDVVSLPPEVSDCLSSLTDIDYFALLCL